MNKSRNVIIAMIIIVGMGCSDEQCGNIVDQMTRSSKEFSRKSSTEVERRDIPDVVREQQQREFARQNTQWTLEKQVLYPVEYCQAQFEVLEKLSERLRVQVHSMAVARAAAIRKRDDAESQIKSYSKLLKEAKDAYRVAEATNHWPMIIGGFHLTRELAEERIVEIAEKIVTLKTLVLKNSKRILLSERRAVRLEEEQRKILLVRERLQVVLEDLKMKEVMDDEIGISAALNNIKDVMSSLEVGAEDPSIGELMIAEPLTDMARKFKEIMAEE